MTKSLKENEELIPRMRQTISWIVKLFLHSIILIKTARSGSEKCVGQDQTVLVTNGFLWMEDGCYACVFWSKPFEEKSKTYKLTFFSESVCDANKNNSEAPNNSLHEQIAIVDVHLNSTNCSSYNDLLDRLSPLNPHSIIMAFHQKQDIVFRALNRSDLFGFATVNATRYLGMLSSNDSLFVKPVFMNDSLPFSFAKFLTFQATLLLIMASTVVITGSYISGIVAHRENQEYQKWVADHEAMRSKNNENAPQEKKYSLEDLSDESNSNEAANHFLCAVNATIGLIIYLSLSLFVLYYFIYYVWHLILFIFVIISAMSLYLNLRFIPRKFHGQRFPNEMLCIGGQTILEVFFAVLCFGVAVFWCIHRNHYYTWILQNILALSICLSVLRLVRLRAFKHLFYILSLLIFYDIFMVFITPHFAGKDSESVMIEVATGGETGEMISLLLKVPHNYYHIELCVGKNPFAALGLGDIIGPGVLISYYANWGKTVLNSWFYYLSSCFLYVIGLTVTFWINDYTEKSQPALLYIIPATLYGVLAISIVRGEFKKVFCGKLPDGVPIIPTFIEPRELPKHHDGDKQLNKAQAETSAGSGSKSPPNTKPKPVVSNEHQASSASRSRENNKPSVK